MITYPNAKINIGLNIIHKRSDGFHDLETIFYPIAITDVLEIIEDNVIKEQNTITFSTSGIEINDIPLNQNICVKAYNIIANDYSIPSVKVHLHKAIPFGAGLGEGSSDAAFMLKLINDKFNLNISIKKLESYAAKLGSDCTFFIQNTASYASGKGEILSKIELDLSKYFFVLVNPNIKINTTVAFKGITPTIPKTPLKTLINKPIENWKHDIKNDFEIGIFKQYPEISEIKKQLYKKGAIYSSMSGSGSSVFGIFKEKPNLSEMFTGYFVWIN